MRKRRGTLLHRRALCGYRHAPVFTNELLGLWSAGERNKAASHRGRLPLVMSCILVLKVYFPACMFSTEAWTPSSMMAWRHGRSVTNWSSVIAVNEAAISSAASWAGRSLAPLEGVRCCGHEDEDIRGAR